MTNLKFGFENEYFVKKDDKIIYVPRPAWPQDAAGWLVEARSDAFANPFKTLESFNKKLKDLEALVATEGCILQNLAMHGHETAGFHIHFSTDEWNGLYGRCGGYGTAPPDDVAGWIARLDAAFEKYYKGLQRPSHFWRPKPYGWEYRRLPATVDIQAVTQFLAQEFWSGYKKIENAA